MLLLPSRGAGEIRRIIPPVIHNQPPIPLAPSAPHIAVSLWLTDRAY